MGLDYFGSIAYAVRAYDLSVRDVPKDEVVIIIVVGVGIQRFAGPFSDRPEGYLAQPVELSHYVWSLRSGDKVGAVIAAFEDGAVADGFDLRTDEFRVDCRDDFLLADFGMAALEIGHTLGLEGVATVAQVLAEILDAEAGDLAGLDRLADAYFDVGSLGRKHLAYKEESADAGVDTAEAVEALRISAVEIDRNYGQAGLADELGHIVCPWLILHDLAAAAYCQVATSPAGKSPRAPPEAMCPSAARIPLTLRAPPLAKLSTGINQSLRLGIRARK